MGHAVRSKQLAVTNLFNKVDTALQVHTEVDELPLNTFLLVFLLLQHEHVMVEELLQTLVGVVDAQLLEGVVLQDTRAKELVGNKLKLMPWDV